MRWDTYNEATKNNPPSKLLQESVGTGGYALDIGAGALNDTRYLLEKGYYVDAVDSNPSILGLGRNLNTNVHIFVSTFDRFHFPVEKYDLVNAQYSLPFNSPRTFDTVFTQVTNSLKPGGVFTGQFFGTEDSWSEDEEMTFHTEEEVKKLLEPYKVHVFRERKEGGRTASGEAKFWHVFNIIAEKK